MAKARALGADESRIVPAATIVTAPWVRLKCQFGCGDFNKSYCCPPRTPTPDQMRGVIDCYRTAILVRCVTAVRVMKIIIALEGELFHAGFYKAMGLGSGRCTLCRSCPPEGCRHPEKARPSLEACGIDVFATARDNGFPAEVVAHHMDEGNYYGVVLIE